MHNLNVTQEQLIAALERNNQNRTKAAKELGMTIRNLQRRLQRLALKGYSPEHNHVKLVPEGYLVKGVSTYYDEEGKVRGQWVKSTLDNEKREQIMREGLMAATESLPALPARKLKGDWNKDLLAVYPIGDPHIGMMAWAEETGDNWDLGIAESMHCQAMDTLVAAAPHTEKAVIINLGDLLHFDSMEAKTPRSGHMLDADGRYAKVIRIAVKTLRQCVESALKKHKEVHVISAIGNHDETGALWLALMLEQIYRNEPRVTVDTSPSVFNYYRFGKTLLGVHHGHTCKPEKLPGVMAADRAEDWGLSKHRYWMMGHIHHESKKEYPGCSVESFGTLAGKDAYAANGGWRSERTMQMVVFHKEFGEVGRSRVVADMFKGA